MKIKISNIEWDTSDGYDGSDLPCYEEMDLTGAIDGIVAIMLANENKELTEAIDDMVDSILSDEHGYPVVGFEIEVAYEE